MCRHKIPWPYAYAGHFQPEPRQFACIKCDSLGDVYQEQSGQASCSRCPQNTQRYLGVLSATNRSACQCKNGACCTAKPMKAPRRVQRVVVLCPLRRVLPPGRQGRRGGLRPPSLFPDAACFESVAVFAFGFAGVQKMSDDPKPVPPSGLSPEKSTLHFLCESSVCEQVRSISNALDGSVFLLGLVSSLDLHSLVSHQ